MVHSAECTRNKELPIAANVWRQNTNTPAARRDAFSDTSRDQSIHVYLQRRVISCVIYALRSDGSRDRLFVLAKRDITRNVMQQVASCHASFVLARRDAFRDGSRDRKGAIHKGRPQNLTFF